MDYPGGVAGYVPYCGPPPAPAMLWSRWNLDPVLIAVLAVAACLYWAGARRGRLTVPVRAAFCTGWAVTAAALISPICALSVSLFSARIGQHMILELVAAPLVAAGRPVAALRGLLGLARQQADARPYLATAAFAALLWFWHAPHPYAATFASTVVYWTMHLTLFGAACWLWTGLLDRTPERAIAATGASVISTVQMGLLGALITLAPRAGYTPHFLTTAAWGLTPLQDQQLGGAIMWVPGCVAFLVAAMAVLGLAWRQVSFAGGRASPT